jgi:hypothetical protein
MKKLTVEQCTQISGGSTIICGNEFILTGNSTLTLGGIKFTRDNICVNNSCSAAAFSTPTSYTFQDFIYNGKITYSITAINITGGTAYLLN